MGTRTKHQRRQQKICKADRRLRIVKRQRYAPHLGYIDSDFDGSTLYRSGHHIRYPHNSHCQRRLKRAASKKARRQADLRGKGNQYRKAYDYWWEMY